MVFELKLKSCILNLLGSAILAFGIYNIHSISGITEGGVFGLVLLFEHSFSISPAISGLILNTACYMFGAKNLGRDFIGYSIFAGGGFSLFYAICEQFPPLFPQIAEYSIVAAILGAVFVGAGVGIAVRAGGAPSGDDALAMSLAHIFKADIKWMYLASDFLVLALSLTYIPLDKILYSLVTVVISGQIISLIQRVGKGKIEQTPDDWGSRDVLVGTLRNVAQLESCMIHRFYHIPAARLYPGDFPIRYIAIYQSNHKFGIDAGVRYFGEVESCALVPRYEIREIPRNSNEMYYRFSIKEWKTLKEPIVACKDDFVNIMTTPFLLMNSREVPELFLLSADERELYLKIKDGICGKNLAHEIKFGEAKLKFNGGKLIIEKDRNELFSCTYDEYTRHLIKIFRKIINIVNQQK